MRLPAALALLGALSLAACGGGAGSSNSVPPGGGGNNPSPQGASENSINSVNSLGTPMKNVQQFNNVSNPLSEGRHVLSAQLGQCNNGREFFAPDKKGDANSTEQQYFYDSQCTQLARDIVRIYTPLSSSAETVARTVSIYALGNNTASATRTSTSTITSATFDQYGFPLAANGFDRVSNSTLNLAGSRSIVSGDEMLLQPANSGTNAFCADSAGYNATGIASLNETFGWQGGVLTPGTRTLNGDGSVTWSATHTGSAFKGAIGSLSLNQGTQNTTCPITTPMFTLSGGTQGGSYNIPVSATYKSGVLENLTITNAQLASGNTLNVTTNPSQPPTSDLFISGIVSNNGTQISTFSVDAFGDGTLTITSSGAQYVINDWHVVK